MRFNESEIVEDILAHIRQAGGDFSAWCVGTARDREGAFFRRHAAADLGDGLIYREAYTTFAADEVIARLVNDCGLQADHESVSHPGKIVFVYRKAGSAEVVAFQLPPRFLK
jgi:hypothetical protein